MGGGEAGPSVEDLMKTWTLNEKKEKRHFSLWTLIKRTFWFIIMFLVMFVIVQMLWKCFELWQIKNGLRELAESLRNCTTRGKICLNRYGTIWRI